MAESPAVTQAQDAKATASVAEPAYLWLSRQLLPWKEATAHITQVGWTATPYTRGSQAH